MDQPVFFCVFVRLIHEMKMKEMSIAILFCSHPPSHTNTRNKWRMNRKEAMDSLCDYTRSGISWPFHRKEREKELTGQQCANA
jgi:hypothetical protein